MNNDPTKVCAECSATAIAYVFYKRFDGELHPAKFCKTHLNHDMGDGGCFTRKPVIGFKTLDLQEAMQKSMAWQRGQNVDGIFDPANPPDWDQQPSNRMKLTSLSDNAPTGTSTGIGCGPQRCAPVELPVYASTERGQQLRQARTNSKLTLLDVAEEFGIGTAVASGLERGAYNLSDEEWDLVINWCNERGEDAMSRAKAYVHEALDRHQQPPLDAIRVASGVCVARMKKYNGWYPWGLEPTNLPCPDHKAAMGERCWGPKAAPPEKALPWTVRVEKFGSGHRTVFSVGNQHFDLARDEDGEDLQHCLLMGHMFKMAMARAGAPRPAHLHRFPGAEDHKGGKPFKTTDCGFGCGAWMGFEKSGAPEGIDPFGTCPAAERGAVYDDVYKLHGKES